MSDAVPRLRMFAGPNGSGKTTVKNELGKSTEWFGMYINPDELEKTIRETGFLSLEPFSLTTDTDDVQEFFANSNFLKSKKRASVANAIFCRNRGIDFSGISFDSYYASVLSDFLRRRAMDAGKSFSFETVMSARDKVDLLKEARKRGFRTYLYYVATDDYKINIDRVRLRVSEGGHDVPEEKIIDRYKRSLELLPEAICNSDRAFFFDTSSIKALFFAESQLGLGVEIVLKTDEMPLWFEPIWDAFLPEDIDNSPVNLQ